VRLRLLSRASDLARIQAMLVGRALSARWPDVEVTFLTRVASGDRDTVTPLASLADKGAFTSDLSNALATGEADAVVHSWKDLPLEGRPDTVIAATLERADPRDVLLVRRAVTSERPSRLRVLSSSPRRAWLLERALPPLLPWKIETIDFVPVRGNIATRVSKLVHAAADGAHGLVVAKAALDRLLESGAPFEDSGREIREAIEKCRWMVLPIRDVPSAPAQAALAVETARDGKAADRIREICHEPTWGAVTRERDVLAGYGGGCHEALGATALPRPYGTIVSVRGRSSSGRQDEGWSLEGAAPLPPPGSLATIWPRPDERQRATRRSLDVAQPRDASAYWIARAEALPEAWTLDHDFLVWAAGTTTWRRLAARGIWVNGCADGLGDGEPPAVDLLAGRRAEWLRLTHAAATMDDPNALATYEVRERLPDDLAKRTHFFWTSGALFLEAISRCPDIRHRWHGAGPGRTWRTIRKALERRGRARVWLDYDAWLADVAPDAGGVS
jgi:hydroxymethylbilane synthase